MPESKKAKIPQRTNTGNRTGNRYTGGAPRKWRRVRLLEVDASALDLVVNGLSIDDALRRIAAAAAADAEAARTALAPLLEVDAWDGGVL